MRPRSKAPEDGAPIQSTPGHQKPNAGLPKLVSMKVTTPQRKELPQIDGQVPRDAGVEGMHPVDFKTFWEQSLFKIFRFLSTSLVVPIFFTSFPGVQEILSCWFAHRKLWSSRCHKIVHSLDFFGVSKLRNQQNMVVVDLRGEDRASGHIAGTVHVRAMDLLKEIHKFAEMFRDQPIVAFFCKYSAHRAPTAAGWITCLSVRFLFSDFKSCTTTVQNPLQKQQFQQGKTKATRSPTSSERAARPNSA